MPSVFRQQPFNSDIHLIMKTILRNIDQNKWGDTLVTSLLCSEKPSGIKRPNERQSHAESVFTTLAGNPKKLPSQFTPSVLKMAASCQGKFELNELF